MKIILEGLFKNTLFKEFIDDYGVCIHLFYDQFFVLMKFILVFCIESKGCWIKFAKRFS